MSTRLTLSLAIALFSSTSLFGQVKESTETAAHSQTIDLTGSEIGLLTSDLSLDNVGADGGALQQLTGKWPEDLVIAPIPGYSPQLGWNLALGGGYFLDIGENDPDTPASVLGGFVMGAENGSYAFGGGGNLHLMNDDLRLKFGAAYLDVRYRFYGIGNEQNDSGISLDLLQNGPMYFATGSWRVWKKLYVGLGYLNGNVDTRFRLDFPDQPFFDPTINLQLSAITVPVEIDSRDHEHFPHDGWLIKVQTVIYRESLGSDFDAETVEVSANHYLPMRDRDVLALRLMAKGTSEDTPFFLMSSFGGSSDLRGYPSGRYRDRMMYAMQAEYRWHFRERWILTGFAGVGEVAESFSSFGDNFLPAAGVGARFVLSDKHRVSLSADIAVGKDGTEFYFGVGEAF